MNYIQKAQQLLREELGEEYAVPEELLDLYTLLMLTNGQLTFNADVHDAWSIWRSRTNPDHQSIVFFDELTRSVQELDQPYTEAIRRAARRF